MIATDFKNGATIYDLTLSKCIFVKETSNKSVSCSISEKGFDIARLRPIGKCFLVGFSVSLHISHLAEMENLTFVPRPSLLSHEIVPP